MILSDRDLMRELASGQLKIEGMKYPVGPASVDVYLGDSFMLVDGFTRPWVRIDGKYPIDPGMFVLGTTVEYIKIPDDIACQVHGCSSIGRTGLFVQNAGWVDPGFEGELTLELFNASSTRLYLEPGQRIAQLSFTYLNSPARNPYRGRYMNQRGATAARPPVEPNR